MTRREGAKKPDAEEPDGVWTPKNTASLRKQPLIATWLSEFEEKIARDFYWRTGLDYKQTIAQIIDHRRRHVARKTRKSASGGAFGESVHAHRMARDDG
jgi:hypothetical protein